MEQKNHPPSFAVLVFYHIRKSEWTTEGSDKLQWEDIPRLAAMCCWITSYVTRKHIFLAAAPWAAELTSFPPHFLPLETILSRTIQQGQRGYLIPLILGWGNYTEVMKLGKGNHWLWYGILTWNLIKIRGWAHGDWSMHSHSSDKSTITQHAQSWIGSCVLEVLQKTFLHHHGLVKIYTMFQFQMTVILLSYCVLS